MEALLITLALAPYTVMRHHPIELLLVAAGVGWFVYLSKRGSRPSKLSE